MTLTDYKLAARPGKCKKSDGVNIKNRAECEKACRILYASFKIGRKLMKNKVGCLVSKGICQWANLDCGKGGMMKPKRHSFRAVCKAAAPPVVDPITDAPTA